MGEIKRAAVRHLAHKIKETGVEGTARFAFFLGAGASVQSGIIHAGEMIRRFKAGIIAECCPEDLKTEAEKEEWLKNQEWYKGEGSEYSKLFEQLEPKEFGRQRYIENLIEGKQPSFGYVVLANLMASMFVNTVMTTNFDDLVYAACTSYTGMRPVTYAYGTLASEMRITSPRPKILKLHGDYLYSSLKNTPGETATQDPNMERQVSQVLNEYGLIVVGYGGSDESIIKILGKISEKKDLYWCELKGIELKDAAKTLLVNKGGFLVEVEGFDEMMNEIRDIVGFDVRGMIGSTYDRQKSLIDQLKSLPGKYHASILPEVVAALSDQAGRQGDLARETQALDYFIQAYQADERRDLPEAERLYRLATELNPRDAVSYNNLGVMFFQDPRRWAEAETTFRKAIEINSSLVFPYTGLGNLYSLQGEYDRAIAEYSRAIKAQPQYASAQNGTGWAYLLKGEPANAEVYLREAIRLDPSDYNAIFNLAAAHALQGRIDEARKLWRQGLTLCQGNSPLDKLNRAVYTVAVGESEDGLRQLKSVLETDHPTATNLRALLKDAQLLGGVKDHVPAIREVIQQLGEAVSRS